MAEGCYSSNPADPYSRIKEFKEMILNLHRNGFRVVMDMVFNHTSPKSYSNFDLCYPRYFYRMNPDGSYSNGSGCGNETASEKDMVRKFFIDSILWWIKEYHIDGFRFDLMGLHDIDTMNAIRNAVNEVDPTVFLYGEGWTAGTFLCGIPGHEYNIRLGITGAIDAWAQEPTQMISYVSCHDDLCLGDRVRKKLNFNGNCQKTFYAMTSIGPFLSLNSSFAKTMDFVFLCGTIFLCEIIRRVSYGRKCFAQNAGRHTGF